MWTSRLQQHNGGRDTGRRILAVRQRNERITSGCGAVKRNDHPSRPHTEDGGSPTWGLRSLRSIHLHPLRAPGFPLPTLSLNRGDILAARGNEGLRRCPFSLRAAAGGSGLVVQRCESTSGELFQSTPSPQLQGICITEPWAKITVVQLGQETLLSPIRRPR